MLSSLLSSLHHYRCCLEISLSMRHQLQQLSLPFGQSQCPAYNSTATTISIPRLCMRFDNNFNFSTRLAPCILVSQSASVSHRQQQLSKLHLHLLLVTQLPPSSLSHPPNTTIIALTPAKHHSSATSQHLSLATSSHHNYFIFAVIVALGRNK
jgi:hypothetical protein